MIRIYANPGLSRRMMFSTIVIVLVIIFGLYELYAAMRAAPGEAGFGFLFAAAFILGGLYGLRQLNTDYGDMVVSVDADGSTGPAKIVVWRPFMSKTLEGPVDKLSNWRFEVRQPRPNLRIPTVFAEHPDHKRPLRFEVGPGITIGEPFRALAPDAFAAFGKASAAS